jgi:hypothetical protein
VIADEYTRWQLAHVLGFMGIVVFAAAVAGLAFMVRRRQPRLGLAGGALGLAGLLGLSGVIALDGFTWGALGHVSARTPADPATVQAALDEVQNSAWSVPFYALGAAWLVGMVLLAIGAMRQHAIPPWAGIAMVLAAILAGTETAVVSNAYFIAGATALLVAGAAVGWSIAAMSDETFARGGPGPPP